MKRFLSVTAGCFGAGFLALTVVLLVLFHDNRKLSEDQRAAESDLQAANARVGDLERDKAELVTELESTRIEVQHLSGRLTETRAAESKTHEPTAARVQLKPYQAPAYLGNDYLGLAWVVPRNILQDPKTGRVTYEPAILLDPGWRQAFDQPAAEVVPAPEPAGPTTVYNSYYNPWPWVIFPAPHHHHTNMVSGSPSAGPSHPPSTLPVVNLRAPSSTMRTGVVPPRWPPNDPSAQPRNPWADSSTGSGLGGAVRTSFAR